MCYRNKNAQGSNLLSAVVGGSFGIVLGGLLID